MKSLSSFFLGLCIIILNQTTFAQIEALRISDRYIIPSDDKVLVDIMAERLLKPFNIDEQNIIRSSLPEVIHFLNWNILKGHRSEFQNEFLNLAQDKNLIFTQEAMNDHNVPQIFRKTSLDNWWMAQSFLYVLTSFGTGVATGSDSNPLHVHFQRSSDIEPIIHTPKIALFTEYQTTSNKKLLTINIHAVNFVTFHKFMRQINAIKEVIQNFQGAVIFAGDFNTWSKRRLAFLKDTAVKLNMEMTEFPDDHRRHKYDFLLVRGCHIQNAEIHYETVGSDHNPITGTIDCRSSESL
jgi:endonuclease/exonuclease/phosphatase (EEP) superfamily protein YafD